MAIKNRYTYEGRYPVLYLDDHTVVDEHRYLAEQAIGRKLDYNEVVHHDDEDKSNGSLGNFTILSRGDHTRLHHPGPKWLYFKCAWCNIEFKRPSTKWRYKIKSGQTDFYCTRSCAAHHFGRGRPKK